MNSEQVFQTAFLTTDNSDTDYFKGLCYTYGYNVERDVSKAKAQYAEGVAKGNAKCKYGLAVLLLKAKNLEEADLSLALFSEAFEELYKQATSDDPISQRMVSCYYLFGDRGVDRDTEEASKWLLKAAQNGDAEAQINLAHCYETGTVFPQDIDLSIEWYIKAAAQGNEKAVKQLDKLRRSENEQILI